MEPTSPHPRSPPPKATSPRSDGVLIILFRRRSSFFNRHPETNESIEVPSPNHGIPPWPGCKFIHPHIFTYTHPSLARLSVGGGSGGIGEAPPLCLAHPAVPIWCGLPTNCTSGAREGRPVCASHPTSCDQRRVAPRPSLPPTSRRIYTSPT